MNGMVLAHAKHGNTLNSNYIFRSLNIDHWMWKLVTWPFMFLSKHQSIWIPSYYVLVFPSYYVLVFSRDILILWTCFFMAKLYFCLRERENLKHT